MKLRRGWKYKWKRKIKGNNIKTDKEYNNDTRNKPNDDGKREDRRQTKAAIIKGRKRWQTKAAAGYSKKEKSKYQNKDTRNKEKEKDKSGRTRN